MQQNHPDYTHPAARAVFRHAIATLGHRFGVAVQHAPAGFSEYLACPGTRSPGQILAHLNVLLEFSANVVRGVRERPEEASLVWDQAVRRFYQLLRNLDDAVVAAAGSEFPLEMLLQGPLSDALTHVGQLTMLRRMAGAPVQTESYMKARIQAGVFEPPL